MGRGKFLLPLAAFALLGVLLFRGLYLNSRDIPSAKIGQPVPTFDLPPIDPRVPGVASSDLTKGQVVLVNVFASWCVACREEHPLLLELKRQGTVPIYGLNYKDDPKDAAAWLDRLGDPYTRIGADRSGRVGLDWGVYGVPETYVIGKDGRIAYKQIGPITPAALRDTILPLVQKLRTAG
jgi:cytochrome c biogenesis protein CcmG/thiol:disulfide interchange protein DsbE